MQFRKKRKDLRSFEINKNWNVAGARRHLQRPLRDHVGFRPARRRNDFFQGKLAQRKIRHRGFFPKSSRCFQAQEQSRRYEGLTSQCRAVQGSTDLAHLVRSVTMPANHPPVRRHFAAPQPPPPQEGPDGQPLPVDPAVIAVGDFYLASFLWKRQTNVKNSPTCHIFTNISVEQMIHGSYSNGRTCKSDNDMIRSIR